jgi:adenylate cyclase
MAQEGFKRKLTAILSADVEGYSRLMGDDEEATVRTLTSYREVLAALIQQHNGKVLDSKGDNLLAEFVSVVDAVQCAVAVQKEIGSRNAELPDNRRMQFRIGINLGDVIQEEDRIYGDGVNIAARLEGLAEPGGICISKTAFDQIETKLPYGYEFLGDQTVKNIAKPVGAYRVLMEPRVTVAGEPEEEKRSPVRRIPVLVGVATVLVLAIAVGIWQFYSRRPSVEPASTENLAYPLPDKPSFAVLPFDNMSKDPELEYLSDGFTDTLIGGLSRIPDIFVIARTSTFAYKGKPVTIKQVAEELGVQYVIEGSTQKLEDQLRVTIQIIDALTGYHIWSERYDRNIKDIFKIQDEITLNIIKSIGAKYSKLFSAAPVNLSIAGTNNLNAYLKNLKGTHYYWKMSAKVRPMAKRLLEEAIELDPKYLHAYITLTHLYIEESRRGTAKFPEKSLEHAFKLAQKTIELNKSSAEAHVTLGRVLYNLREHDKAILVLEKAIALDPDYFAAHLFLGWTLNYAGRAQEAATAFKKTIRLNPLNPHLGLLGLSATNIFIGNYEDAIPYLQEAIKVKTKWGRLHVDLAACYAALGREEEAKVERQEVLRLRPKFSLKKYIMKLPTKDPKLIKPYIDALRKTGLPE